MGVCEIVGKGSIGGDEGGKGSIGRGEGGKGNIRSNGIKGKC